MIAAAALGASFIKGDETVQLLRRRSILPPLLPGFGLPEQLIKAFFYSSSVAASLTGVVVEVLDFRLKCGSILIWFSPYIRSIDY